jgi:hypothetical protein
MRSKQVSEELDKNSGVTDGLDSSQTLSQWPKVWVTVSQWLVSLQENKSWTHTKQSSSTLSVEDIFNALLVWKF